MSPRRGIPPRKNRTPFPSWMIIGALVIAAAIAVVGVVWVSNSQGESSGISGDRTAGDPQAPIAFVEFSDFQ